MNDQWHQAAEAVVYVWKNGGWQLSLLLIVAICAYRKPWFRDKS